MATLIVSTHVAAPLERVFEVIPDIPKAAERIPGITKIKRLSEGPFRIGTRWRETRVIMKKEDPEEMWVTGFDPPRSYAVEAESRGTQTTPTSSSRPTATAPASPGPSRARR